MEDYFDFFGNFGGCMERFGYFIGFEVNGYQVFWEFIGFFGVYQEVFIFIYIYCFLLEGFIFFQFLKFFVYFKCGVFIFNGIFSL